MSDTVKRFEANYIPGHPPLIVTNENGSLCLFGELEVERLSHEKTKAQLEALEDILLAFDNCRFLSDEQNEAHYRALQNSRARNKT